LKLLAIDAIADRNLLSQFPAGIPQATFLGAAVPLESTPWSVPAVLLRKLEDGTMEASTNDRQMSASCRKG
jgi:hypothetical protein